MLIKPLEEGICLDRIKANTVEVFEQRCYQALATIKNILEDKECFVEIEKIVCVLEELDSDCGIRHDFG